jgi:hypothetical protein
VTLSSASGSFITASAPEPATWSLMLVGFGGLGAALRRRAGRGGLPADREGIRIFVIR